MDWLRDRVTTTPGRLAVISALVIAGAVCFGILAGVAEHSRARGAQAVRAQTEPLLVQAVTLYTALSDANATATTTFLHGGLEPPVRRAHYLQELRIATDSLATLTREVGSSRVPLSAVRTITQRLPVYTGLVEDARANNLQGFPAGAAYLRQASALLTQAMLPAAKRLYRTEAERLSDNYDTGQATLALVVTVIVVVVALGLLIAAQLYLTRVTQRNLNVPMVLATVVLAALSIWALIGLINEQNALAAARDRGSDSVEVLSATRVLLSRAQSDESLTLVNRGSDQIDPVDFASVMRVLRPPNGLVGEAQLMGRRTRTSAAADQLVADFSSYQTETARIERLEGSGRILAAIALASSPASAAVADRLNANLSAQISAAQTRFNSDASDATSSLAGLAVAIPVLTLLAAGLALLGLRQRMGEYR